MEDADATAYRQTALLCRDREHKRDRERETSMVEAETLNMNKPVYPHPMAISLTQEKKRTSPMLQGKKRVKKGLSFTLPYMDIKRT